MPSIKDSFVFKNFCGAMKNLTYNRDKSVLCAFSGGADSALLTNLLAEWFFDTQKNGCTTVNSSYNKDNDHYLNISLKATEKSFFKSDWNAKLYFGDNIQKAKLFACHINHMIRGEEAVRDELFCINKCRELNIPLFVVSADIPTLSKEIGTGIEETARNFRYDIFNRITKEYSVSYIATAHNADDNLETLIFNLVRGTGTKGLIGIEGTRDNIIRPLLGFTKGEIVSFCKEYNIDYVTDSTNLDINYTRNYIRNEIVPKLKKLNPEAASAAQRLSFLAKQDNLFIESELNKIQGNLSISELQKLPYALLSRYINREYLLNSQIITGKEQTLSYVNIEDFIAFISNGKEGASLSLPNLIKASINQGKLVFSKDKEIIEPDQYCFPLMEGQNTLPSGEKIFVLFNEEGKNFLCKYINVYKLFIYAELNFDKIKNTVFVRTRKSGDKYRINNMTKSVKKLFSEKKIPLQNRGCHPIICDSEGIIWIPEFPVRDGFTPDTNEAKNKLYLFYIKEN